MISTVNEHIFLYFCMICYRPLFRLYFFFCLGPRGDYVSAVLCQGRPMEYRHYCVPVPDWKGPFPGPNSTTAQTFLRKACRTETKVSYHKTIVSLLTYIDHL